MRPFGCYNKRLERLLGVGGEKLRIPIEYSQIYESLNEMDINLKLRKEFWVIVIKKNVSC